MNIRPSLCVYPCYNLRYLLMGPFSSQHDLPPQRRHRHLRAMKAFDVVVGDADHLRPKGTSFNLTRLISQRFKAFAHFILLPKYFKMMVRVKGNNIVVEGPRWWPNCERIQILLQSTRA